MTFKPLNHALGSLEQQSAWESYQQYRLLLQAWKQIVAEPVARQTRPLFMNRNILWVATASAAWAQTLSLSRRSLLKGLRDRLAVPLADIRFSTARWSDPSPIERTQNVATTHPSQIDPPNLGMTDFRVTVEIDPRPPSPQAAFERWSVLMQLRSRDLPPCPCCQLPTPQGELERWSICAYCIRQTWGNSPPPDRDRSPDPFL